MMQFTFLKDFDKRMKSVGRYVMLFSNSSQKSTWKNYGVDSLDEQVNMIFTVLLYIMEASLKEEDCTIDDIAGFLNETDYLYYKRNINDKSVEMADFIVNVILSNSGSAMYFKAYDYEKKEYADININYIANKIVYQENGVRRTSYYLTEEGYNMMLATMELENNLKLTVHEMLFKMHLEKADYNRAAQDIKNVFDRLRIQNQKIQEAMHRIRRNALLYTVEEYKQIVEENLDTVEKTREKFRLHKEYVDQKVREFEEDEMHADEFSDKEKENLENLRIIGGYLAKSLDEHQKILNEHFDLKKLYSRELENYSNMTMVQRFSFRSELYDKVLEDASLLKNMDVVFNPLYRGKIGKIYNPNKAFEYQKKIRKDAGNNQILEIELDDEEYLKEKEEKLRRRLRKYYESVRTIMDELLSHKRLTLSILSTDICGEHEELKNILIPTVEIFREVLIEFLSVGETDINKLIDERSKHVSEESTDFQLNEMILTAIERHRRFKGMNKICVVPVDDADKVYFYNVPDENGDLRTLRCSDIELWYE